MAALEAGVRAIRTALRGGEKVRLSGVGVLVLRTRSARHGRHPATGAPMVIPAVHHVHFKAGRALLEALAGSGEGPMPAADGPAGMLLAAVARVLRAGEAAGAPGLGTWRVRAEPERRGRNPATGAVITIPARVGVRFTVDPSLLEALAD